jgi:hypothetical protein
LQLSQCFPNFFTFIVSALDAFLTILNLLLKLGNLLIQICFGIHKRLELLAVIGQDGLFQHFALCLKLLLNGTNLGLRLILDGHPLLGKVFLKILTKLCFQECDLILMFCFQQLKAL